MGKFTKNVLITLVNGILQLILGIIASVIITRVLGAEGRGIYSLAILLPTLIIIFTNLGIAPASVYYISIKKYSIKEVFGNSVILSFLISILAALIGLIIILFYSDTLFPGVSKIYLFLSLSLIPFQTFFNFGVNILLGLQKIKKYNFIQLIQMFFFLLIISIFLLGLNYGIKETIIAEVLSFLIVCIILGLWIKKEIGGISFKLDNSYLKDFFSYGFKSYLGNIATFLHFRIDYFLINFFLNPVAVGLYYVSVVITERIWLISKSVGTVLFPKLSSEQNEKKIKEFTPLVCRNTLFITSLLIIILFILGNWIIVFLYSEEFLDSVLPFRILLIGALSISASRILSYDLYSRGKPILSTYSNIIAVALNIFLNIILIPKYSIVGAASATSISYTVAFFVNLFFYMKISGNKLTDIIFIKKSDLKLYRNLILIFRKNH